MSFSPIDFIFIGWICYELYFCWVLRNFDFTPANEIFSKKGKISFLKKRVFWSMTSKIEFQKSWRCGYVPYHGFRLSRHFFKSRFKKGVLGNSNHFCLFLRICEIFRNSKKKYVQELWALTFHGITVFKNSNGVQRIVKFMFSGIHRLAKIANPENTNFAILRTPLGFFNTVTSWKVRANNSWTYFFFEFSKNLANSWRKTKMIRISLKF